MFKQFVSVALLPLVCCVAAGQEKPKGKRVAESPAFLIEALNHRSQAIRLRAAQLLTEEDVDATPALVDSLLTGGDLPGMRAAVVLIDRLDLLRRVTSPEKEKSAKPRLELTPQERGQVRRLLAVVREPRAEAWRLYLAVYVLDKVLPDALAEVVPELAAAAACGEGMKQYAAVQAMYRLGPAAREGQAGLWRLLLAPCRFRGLYLPPPRLPDDDALAYTDQIGVYDIQFGLEASFVIPELFILETLRRVGAPHGRLTAALACFARHESPHVRLDVARQLGLLDASAQSLAANVLSRLLCDPRSVLNELLSDDNDDIRDEAAELFTRLGPAAAKTVPALVKLLSHRENRLRQSAAIILGQIGPAAAEAVPALERALRFERLREGEDAEILERALERIRKK